MCFVRCFDKDRKQYQVLGSGRKNPILSCSCVAFNPLVDGTLSFCPSPFPPLTRHSSLSLLYGNLVNKPFRPCCLHSHITHAIFIHVCHSRSHISAIIFSLFSFVPQFLISAPLSRQPQPLSFLRPLSFPPATSSLPALSFTRSTSRSVYPSAYIERVRRLRFFFRLDAGIGRHVEGTFWRFAKACAVISNGMLRASPHSAFSEQNVYYDKR